VDSENAAPRLLEFQRLIPDSVGIAMRAADPADFLGWVRERLLKYAAPDSPLHADSNLGRAMAFAWARAVWNGLVQCAEVIAALEPRLATPERYHDEDTAILLHLLCEAYGMSPDGARRLLQLNPSDDHRVGSALEHLSHS
jgi:hypothetical protein